MFSQIAHALHKHFLLILLGAYALAACLPQPGLWLREISFGTVHLGEQTSIKLTLSTLMLSFLLFNAGLGIKTSELNKLVNKPLTFICGFAANLVLPVSLVVLTGGLLKLWHNPDELQNLLVGVALIAAMPIAGSSTAWSQNSNGNLGLSLGLVLLSTLFSPLTTPFVLHFFSQLTIGDYSSDLKELAQQGTNAFMCVTVVAPSLCGICVHYLLGHERVSKVKSLLKVINYAVLLCLNYSNASISLPEAVMHPDWDFLAFIFGFTLILCFVAFSAGWLLAKLLKTDQGEKAALMFGLGMNNNGTGLVLAGLSLADHPSVMLPMIFYTLIQQVMAAGVDRIFFASADRE